MEQLVEIFLHFKHITPKSSVVVGVVYQGSVCGILLGRNSEWNIKVAIWQVKRSLFVVAQEIETIESEIHVLACFVFGVVLSMSARPLQQLIQS